MRISLKAFRYLAAIAVAFALVCSTSHVSSAQEAEHPAASGGTATGAAAAQPNPLAVDPDLAIWTLVVFVILFAVLAKFAWPQITAALEERERKIADNIAAAEARHEEAKRLLAEHEAKLAAAAGEIRALLEEARRDADHTRQSIEAEGHKAAQDELARAVREIERARDAAIRDLAVASANVAIDIARDVVRQEISADRQNQIVREALGKLTTVAPSKN